MPSTVALRGSNELAVIVALTACSRPPILSDRSMTVKSIELPDLERATNSKSVENP
jgi:hypothetical protein